MTTLQHEKSGIRPVTATGAVDARELNAEVNGGAAGGAEESGCDKGMTINAVRATVVQKEELLRVYPLMWELFRALDKPYLTWHETLEQLMALARRAGRVGMASRRRGVVEIEAEQSGGG